MYHPDPSIQARSGCARGVGRDRRVVRSRVDVVEVAPHRGEPAPHRVDVGVDEAGEQEAAPQVDRLGPPTGEPPDLLIRADRRDPAAPEGERRRPLVSEVGAPQPTPVEHEVGGRVVEWTGAGDRWSLAATSHGPWGDAETGMRAGANGVV